MYKSYCLYFLFCVDTFLLYPNLNLAIFLYNLVSGMSILDLSETLGVYLNNGLPVSYDHHCLCHCERPHLIAACLISAIVTVWLSDVMAAASDEASLNSLSASSFPLMLAFPGVQEKFTAMFLFLNVVPVV